MQQNEIHVKTYLGQLKKSMLSTHPLSNTLKKKKNQFNPIFHKVIH